MAKINILSGPYGTELEKVNPSFATPLAPLESTTSHHLIQKIAENYLKQGIDGITIPAFGARQLLHSENPKIYFELVTLLYQFIQKAIESCTKTRKQAQKILQILSLGSGSPVSCYDCETAPSKSEAGDFHDSQIFIIKKLCEKYHLDFGLFETLTTAQEAIGIVERIRKYDIPAVLSFVVDDKGNTYEDQPIGDVINEVKSHCGSSILGCAVNCFPPKAISQIIQNIRKHGAEEFLVGLYPNADNADPRGLDAWDGKVNGTANPQSIAENLCQAGLNSSNKLNFLAGCCGFTPDDIKILVRENRFLTHHKSSFK